jgi:GAF domain-containing protein
MGAIGRRGSFSGTSATQKQTMPMKAPLPKNEKKRLEVLWQYDVLDTIPEQVFTDLADLAASICDAPMALITLVDEKRQWFKAKHGVSLSETSRDVSFCAHAMLQHELFIVPDASKDQRFADNPLVISEPKIRFYAGAPLFTPDGYALGTLCVIDKVPRNLRPDQKRALEILSRHVMTQLELRRHAQELARSNAEREGIRADLLKVQAELEAVKHALGGGKPKARNSGNKAGKRARRS